MALYTEAAARACLRNKDGKRVFYLGKDDRLTDAARDFLRENHVEILPAESARPAGFRTLFGATITEKPEHMTHLNSEILVMKDHPRIQFRGEIDSLEAEILLAQKDAAAEGYEAVCKDLEEILGFVRRLIRCDVLGEPLPAMTLCGLTEKSSGKEATIPRNTTANPISCRTTKCPGRFCPAIGYVPPCAARSLPATVPSGTKTAIQQGWISSGA